MSRDSVSLLLAGATALLVAVIAVILAAVRIQAPLVLVAIGVITAVVALALIPIFRSMAELFFQQETGVSVPVVVDAVRDVAGTNMIRAIYFVATSEIPGAGWFFNIGIRMRFPIRVLGRTGILYRPSFWVGTFRSCRHINRLIDGIESNAAYTVENEDLWLPVQLFGSQVDPGQVFRVPFVLFQMAFRFRAGELSQERFIAQASDGPRPQYSAIETGAFREWAQDQIDEAKKLYPKNPDRELRWSES